MEDAMTHQLLHSFDHCTAKVDWSDPRHYACSEIRAQSLSGECKFFKEFSRGFVGIYRQHQKCVKRRAIKNVSKKYPNEAEDAVNSVFDECFRDTSPFDEIY
jgi:inner membrane protease ATP23